MNLKYWQEEREQERRQNQKLEAVAYLRSSSARNRQRMGQVRSILYGEPYISEETENRSDKNKRNRSNIANIDNAGNVGRYDSPDSSVSSDNWQKTGNREEERAFWLSFFRRTILCGAVIALLYMGDKSGSTAANRYKKEIKSLISVDYSENLFDFIQQIPYTFDYEKINVEG